MFLFGLITKTRDITLDNTQPETEISYIYSKIKDQLGLFRIFGNKGRVQTVRKFIFPKIVLFYRIGKLMLACINLRTCLNILFFKNIKFHFSF